MMADGTTQCLAPNGRKHSYGSTRIILFVNKTAILASFSKYFNFAMFHNVLGPLAATETVENAAESRKGYRLTGCYYMSSV